jgi:hypothetical protein
MVKLIVAALMLLITLRAHAAENVLIVGGAGNSGSAIAKMLIARGDKVTVMVRPTTDRSLLLNVPVDYIVADAMDPDAIAKGFERTNFTIIFEILQILAITEQQSYSRAYANLVPWAKAMNVKQFVSISSGCGDRAAQDCPLSPPLYKVADDQTKAEHILRDAGVPYTIFRLGTLLPGNMEHPAAYHSTGKSYLTEDQSKFGVILRADFDQQIFGCIGAARCINKIFVMDDPTLKPQLDHWLCKRSHETDKIIFNHPACGEMPQIAGAPR